MKRRYVTTVPHDESLLHNPDSIEQDDESKADTDMINADAEDNTNVTSDYNAEMQEDEFETNNRISIEDTNITTEMNNSQMAVQENENHEQETQDVPEPENRTNHRYNLRKRPTNTKK